MVARKRTAQWGSIPQQIMPEQENGTSYVIQAGAGHGKSMAGLRPSNQVVQQELSSAAPSQNSSSEIRRQISVTSQQSVNQVPVTTPLQHQADLRDTCKAPKQGIPSKLNLQTSVPQGKEKPQSLNIHHVLNC